MSNLSDLLKALARRVPDRDGEIRRILDAELALQSGAALAVSLANSVNQPVTSSVNTILSWDTEAFDDDTMHEGVTHPSRITIRTPGRYLIVATVRWTQNGTGVRQLQFNKNGATSVGYQTGSGSSVAGGLTTTYLDSCIAGDYFEVLAYQESGVSLNALASGSTFQAVRQ